MSDLYITKKITDFITRIHLPGNVYSYLVEGEKKAILIDTGCGAGPYRAFIEHILQGKPYEVVLTHGHVDHAGGASEFERVWLHPSDYRIAAEHTQKARRAGYLKQDDRFCFTDEDLVEPKESGYLPLSYGQTFDLGGEILEILCFGGHTPGSIGILFKNEEILLTGDACCSFTLLFGGEDSLSVDNYKKNLQEIYEHYRGNYKEMLYSHPHNWGGIAVIPEMIEICEEILAGRDEHEPIEFAGRSGFAAKKTEVNASRADGKIANLTYVMD